MFNAVILQWAKFLEPLNIGYPQIIKSIESEFEPRGLQKERRLLEKIQDRCFYCEKILEKNALEYVLKNHDWKVLTSQLLNKFSILLR